MPFFIVERPPPAGPLPASGQQALDHVALVGQTLAGDWPIDNRMRTQAR